jgi:hypothetical protein
MYIENAYITIGYWFPWLNCDGFSFPFNLFHNARKRKTEVLKVYELIQEAYRQIFRSFKKYESQNDVSFIRETENLW